MRARVLILLVVTLVASACATRYATLRIVSDPPDAYVDVVETQEQVGQTPDHTVVEKTFRIFQRRRVAYRLRFRSAGRCEDIVQAIIVPENWYRTRAEAENGARFTTAAGVLQPGPCQCKCDRNNGAIGLFGRWSAGGDQIMRSLQVN